MRALGVVVVAPGGDFFAGFAERAQRVHVQALVAELPVQALDEGVSRTGLPGSMNRNCTPVRFDQSNIARLAPSGPSPPGLEPVAPQAATEDDILGKAEPLANIIEIPGTLAPEIERSTI
ncbi:MAG: hypothetical protein AAFR47_18550 [Pseudomonadota bacterium]